jgi:hypothetical protein
MEIEVSPEQFAYRCRERQVRVATRGYVRRVKGAGVVNAPWAEGIS